MIKVGIIGGAGYTAGELLRLLIHHPEVEIVFTQSKSHHGEPVSKVHQDLVGETEMIFDADISDEADVVFLCLGHGKSVEFLNNNDIPEKTKIIDLSQDFRLSQNAVFKERTFTYGLPELSRGKIKKADNIANPGCFATCIQLGILPLAAQGWVHDDIHINAITGSTGAGQSPSATTHFSWRNNNVSVYKAFSHQHLGEISESFLSLQPQFDHSLNFIPVRGNFTRGIFATSYTKKTQDFEKIVSAYKDFYADAAFTFVSDQPIHLKQVVNTNKTLIHLSDHGDKVLITSITDNLLKGASGQAIQNMNLMFGIDERAGLQLKSTLF